MGKSRTLVDLLSKTVGPGNSDTTELKAGYSTLPENRYSDFKTWYNNLKNNPSHEDDYGDFRDILDSEFGLWSNRAFNPDQFNAQSVIDWAARQGIDTDEADVYKTFHTIGLIPDHIANKKMAFDYSNTGELQKQINTAYQKTLGRNAVFDPTIDYDADYWVGELQKGGADKYGSTTDDIQSAMQRYLEGSAEFKNPGQFDLGGVNFTDGVADLGSQRADNSYLKNFDNTDAGMAAAANALTGINASLGQQQIDDKVADTDNPYLNRTYQSGTITDTGTGDSNTGGNWYDGYASGEEWLAANPQNTNTGTGSDSGFGDFQKFMMMMMMMNMGGRGGGYGGGYGGSQYGYGGLNPGGVMSNQAPWWTDQSAVDSFKSIWS